MELFKLFGTIAIDNAKAMKSLDETSKEAKNTRTVFDKAFEEIGKKAVDVFKKDMPQSLKHTTDAIESQKNELNSLKKRYKDACLVFGENSKEAKSLGKQIKSLSTELQENKEKLKNAESAADKFDKSLEDVKKKASETDTKLEKFGKTLGNLGTSVLKGTAIALGAVTTGIIALGASAVKYNATMESYSTSFETMTGSAEKASETMDKLKDLGAKTPFEFEDLASATQLLMNYGFTADGAVDSMMMLGDIAQGDAEKMQRVAMAYGQMSSAGKVSLEDVKQMIEAGFNPLQEISESTGESMESLYQRISDGTLSVEEITAAMERSTSEGGKYFQSMEKQSKTVAGQFSTLKDNFKQMTGEIFKGVSEMIGTKALPILIGWVDKLTKAFKKNGIDGLLDALGGILGEGLSYITDALPDIAEMGFNILCSLLDGILENVDAIAEAGTTLVEVLIDGIAEFLPKFTNTAQQLVYKFIYGLGQALPQIMTTITGMMIDLVNIAIANIPLVVQAGISILQGLLQGILDALPMLLEALPELVQNLADTLLEQIPVIIDAGTDLLTALVDNLPTIIDTIVEVLPQIITGITDALTENLPTIVSAGVALFVALVQNMDDILRGIAGAIPALIEGIADSLLSKDNLEDMKDAGVDIIYSFLEGLQTAWQEVTSWFSAAINGLTSGASSAVDAVNIAGAASRGSAGLTTGRGKSNTSRSSSVGSSVGGSGTRRIGGYADGGVVPKGHMAFLEGYGDEAVVPLHNNKKWISAVAQDMNNAIGTNNLSGLEAKFDRMLALMEKQSNTKIYLDSGVLVGELTDGIDASLGEVDNLRRRGG